MPRQNNPYASNNPYAAGNPYAGAPDVTGLDERTGEGEYLMTNKYGGRLPVSYSKVRQASQAGYTMQAADRTKFVKDSAADKNVASYFPDLTLPEGVKIVGMNSAGLPIVGPVGTAPKGSATRRFLGSATEQVVGPVAGVYHAFADTPKTPEEAQAPSGSLALRRLLYYPSRAEWHKAMEEGRQANQSTGQDRKMHQMQAIGHGVAAAIPLLGPAAAGIGETGGKQLGSGDYAGALGTVAGVAAMEAAPKLGAGVGGYVTRAIPEHIVTRIIRPMGKDVEFGKNPVRAILDEGIVASNLPSMAKKVADRMDTVGQDIDKMVADPKYANKQVDLNYVYEPLNKAIDEAEKAGDRKLYRRLWDTRSELRSEWQVMPGSTRLKRTGRRGMMMSPTDALKFRRMVGDRIRWSQDALDEPVNGALGGVYSNIKDKINAAIPDPLWKELNQRYADLVSAKSAIERRAPVAQRQSIVSLFDLVLGGTGHWPLLAVKKAFDIPAVATPVARGVNIAGKAIPKNVPLRASVPAVAAMQGQRKKTPRELQEEARRLAGLSGAVQTGTNSGADTPQ